jgi:hypothetical protein
VNVPEDVNVWMINPPEDVIVPPVAFCPFKKVTNDPEEVNE